MNTFKNQFASILLKWNKEKNFRQMPWKGEKDAYKIWLSEIILQQTRVEQGWQYYLKFIKKYPTIKSLATAKDEEVFKLWEGLGYYTRCKNLLHTARQIASQHKGIFPTSYSEIRKLKGIGDYTAAAIASFAYNLPHAVVDGNVLRILSRIFGINKPIDTTEGKKYFSDLAHQLLSQKFPSQFNQAIMDFGATVCLPRTPLCSECCFQKNCFAFKQNAVALFPFKSKKLISRTRYFNYIVFKHKNSIAIFLRTKKDIWNGLNEFYLLESKKYLSEKNIIDVLLKNKIVEKNKFSVLQFEKTFKQQLTHQKIHASFLVLDIKKKPNLANADWVMVSTLATKAFPKIIREFLGKQTLLN